MYKRKYGRMTSAAWLNAELEQTSLFCTLFCGIILTVANFVIRSVTGSPYRIMLELGIADIMPPVWLFSLLQLLGFLTIGCAAGIVLGWKDTSCAVDKYKGALFFVLMAVIELCWYPTLFGGGLVFLCVLEALLMTCLSLMVVFCFFRISGLSGILLSFHCVWIVYLLIFTCAVFFRN